MVWICITLIIAILCAITAEYTSIGGRIWIFIAITCTGVIATTFFCVIFGTAFTPTEENCEYSIEQHFLEPMDDNYITFSNSGSVWVRFADTGYYNDDTLDNNTYYRTNDEPYYIKCKWGVYKIGTLPWWLCYYAGNTEEQYYLNYMNIHIS